MRPPAAQVTAQPCRIFGASATQIQTFKTNCLLVAIQGVIIGIKSYLLNKANKATPNLQNVTCKNEISAAPLESPQPFSQVAETAENAETLAFYADTSEIRSDCTSEADELILKSWTTSFTFLNLHSLTSPSAPPPPPSLFFLSPPLCLGNRAL